MLLKAQNNYISQKSGGVMAPLALPGYAYAISNASMKVY